MKRRKFLKCGVGSLLTAPLILNRYSPLYANNYASPLVSVFDDLAASVKYKEGKVVNSDGVIVDKILSFDIVNSRVARMVDTAVMKITNKPSVGEAWESLFPAGHPNMDTRIGIKLNFSYGDWRNDIENDWAKTYCPFGTKAAVTNAIVCGLSQMLDGTFPIENITLIERMYLVGTRRFYPVIQGYRPVSANDDGLFKNTSQGTYSVHWIFSTNPLELPPDAPQFIAAPDFTGEYQAPQRIYSAVYRNDFLINYAIAKDHRAAGITGSMKNNYGCTDNPFGTHGNKWNSDDSPYAGTRLCVPVFYKNVNQNAPFILNILDAITGVYDGGPLSGKIFHANTIAVSKDPVAIDSYLLNMINKARQERGLAFIDAVDGRTAEGHPNASFLRIATEKHELGSMSQDNLQSIDLSSNDGSYDIPALQNSHSLISEVRMSNNTSKLQVFLDKSNREHSIVSRIEDVNGKVIRSFKSHSTRSSLVTLEWDHKDDNQAAVREGIYVWYVWADEMMHTSTINSIF
jgi:hypothetical protein